ncbi:carboxylesterase family protein [Microbacterium sp. NPDC076911]|uniref:carboxylesterase/lipase family protein n=1 Tax=Microbacterium sp. NPDC076911 TaxID=3154958 RepID=UPI003416375A
MHPADTDLLGSCVTVTASVGRIIGRATEGVDTFLGIPYAEAPVRERRFAAPVARAHFSGSFDANVYGATPQRVSLFATTTVPEPTIPGEDVLTLNIFAPSVDIGGGHPVLVWVHGGGFVAGSAASPWYNGVRFAREGVVVVTLSYRLAVEGFAPLPGIPTNLGLRDVILALKWVQANITAFGGDPKRVTLAGQSAGGGIALALMSSPAAVGLMHRVVSISGGIFAREREQVLRYVDRLASVLRVAPTRAGFADVTDVATQRAIADLRNDEGTDPLSLSPVVGDDVLPEQIVDGLARRNLDVPLLIGSTLDEFDGGPTNENPTSRSFSDDERAVARASGQRMTDILFRSAVPQCAAARAGAPGGTWSYSFEWQSPLLGGATHCTDIPYFFDVLDAPGVADSLGESTPREVARAMHSDLLAFVCGDEPKWRQTSGARGDISRVYGRVDSPPATDIAAVYDPVTRG